MIELRVINDLPQMQCDKDCGDCCGPVPCLPSEFDAVVSYAAEHGIEPKSQGTTCPYYQGGACTVYPVRPLLCQLFGHVDRLVCTRGYNVNIGRFREREIMEPYLLRHKLQGTRWLHEVFER